MVPRATIEGEIEMNIHASQPTITPRQCRAARAALGYSLDTLHCLTCVTAAELLAFEDNQGGDATKIKGHSRRSA
jgi:hypothetical protein